MVPAGFVSFGEHPEETVIREMKEETGYKAKITKLLGVEQSDDDPRSTGHFAFFYKVLLEGKIMPVDEEENSEICWFSLKKLPKICWHSHRKILKKLGGVLK